MNHATGKIIQFVPRSSKIGDDELCDVCHRRKSTWSVKARIEFMEIGFICSIDKMRWESNPCIKQWMWFDKLDPEDEEEDDQEDDQEDEDVEEKVEVRYQDVEIEYEEKGAVPESMDAIKTAALIDALRRNLGNVRAAARDLRIRHCTVYRLLQRSGYRTTREKRPFQKKERGTPL